jgi:hypothetical protein
MKRIPITNAVFGGFYNLDRLMSAGCAARVPLSDRIPSTYEWCEQNWGTVSK